MRPLWELPESILLLLAQFHTFAAAASTSYSNGTITPATTNPSAGTGASKTTNSSNDGQPTTYSNASIQSLSSCDSSWGHWTNGLLALSNAQASSTLTSTTYTSLSSTWNCANGSGATTKLCDGAPRCLKGTATTWTKTYTSDFYNISVPTYPTPSPTCTVNTDDCGNLWGAYDSLKTSYPDLTMTMPYCSEWQGFGTWSNPCSQCFVSASTVRLLYWPVTVANQNPCGNDSTISPTGPSTTIFEGSVVTSPYAYLSFDTLSAFGTGYVPCGATHTNVLVPVKPDQISSFRGPAAWEGSNDPNNHPPPYPFNYADLNYRTLNNSQSYPLVPKEAYEGQQQCYPGNCSTIYPNYAPMIGLNAAEAKFSSIDPNWGDCGFDFFGFYDPPLPLTTAGVLATPTPPSKPTTNPAQPAPTPAPQQPPKTGGGGHHTPKVAHTEEPVPPAAPSAPAPQPATPGATLGSGNSGAGGGNDNSNGADSATGLGGIIASIVGSNQGSSTNSGGSGGQGSNSGGSDSGNAGSSGNGGNGGGDSNLGGVSSGGNGQSGPSQGGNGGSSNAGGANNNGGSAGGQVPGNAHHGSGSNGGGQTAVITGSNGRTMTASQLPANAGGSHGVGSVFTISGSGVSPTTISIGGPPATLGGVELSAAPAGIAARPTSSSRGGQAGGGEGGGGWTTVPLSPAGAGSPSATEALLTLPGSGSGPAQTITASQEAPGVFVVPASGSSPAITLSVGGSPANVGGVALSAGSGGIVIGGSTTVVPSAVGGGGGSGPAPLATEAIFTLTASADGVSQIVTASQISPGVFVIPASGSSPAVTLSVGGQASTVDGVVLSAGSNGIVVGGSTTIAPSTVALEEGAVLTLSGSDGPDTHTAVEVRNGVFVIPNTTGGKDITLSVGGSAITIDGTVISAAETGLVVGGKSTVPVNAFAVPTSETTGLGGYIVSGLGASGTGTQQFDGAGSRSRAGEINALIAAMLGVAVGGAILI